MFGKFAQLSSSGPVGPHRLVAATGLLEDLGSAHEPRDSASGPRDGAVDSPQGRIDISRLEPLARPREEFRAAGREHGGTLQVELGTPVSRQREGVVRRRIQGSAERGPGSGAGDSGWGAFRLDLEIAREQCQRGLGSPFLQKQPTNVEIHHGETPVELGGSLEVGLRPFPVTVEAIQLSTSKMQARVIRSPIDFLGDGDDVASKGFVGEADADR